MKFQNRIDDDQEAIIESENQRMRHLKDEMTLKGMIYINDFI